MQAGIYLLIGLVVGYLIGQRSQVKTNDNILDVKLINPEQVRQRQEHLQKILDMARQKGEVANDEVQKALGISDSTAQRYLQDLVDEGKLTQRGQSGKSVIYKAI